MFHGEYGGYGFMGFGWIFIILIIILIVFIFRNRDESGKSKAQDILDERYAKGEIDLEEYREKSKHLAD